MADIMQAFIRLRPDDTGFAEEAAAKVKKGTKGTKASVPLAVDDKQATVTLDKVRARLADLSGKVYNAGLNVNDSGAQLRLAKIALTLDKLNTTTANAKIKVDGVAKAEVELLGLEHQFSKLQGQQAGVRASSVRLQQSLAKLTPAWTGWLAAGLAVGPALIPILTVVSGLVVGIGAAAIAGGAAFGIFGAVASYHLAQLKKDLTAVQAANKAANVALATPEGKRTSSQKQAIANARQLTAEFKKNYGELAEAQEKLTSAWKAFSGQSFINNTLAKLFNLLTTSLPKINPLLRLGANAVQVFVAAVAGWVQGGGLDRLVKGLAALGSNVAIPGFIKILHNLATTFGALAPEASKFAAGAVGGLVHLTDALAKWAQSKGSGAMQSFLALVRKDGPQVGHLIAELAAAVPNLVRGLNPLAPVSLAIATALAKIIAVAPPGVITGLAIAFVGLYGAVKVLSAATTVYNGVEALLALRTKAATVATKLQVVWSKLAAGASKVWAAAQWLLNAALDANPIGLVVLAITALVGGLILAYQHSETFRKIVQAAFHKVWQAVQFVWNWIKHNWPLLLSILTGPIGTLVIFVVRHFRQVKDTISQVWKDIQIFVLTALKNILTGLGHLVDFMAKLPGPLGKPFKAASEAIHGTIGHVTDLITSLKQVKSKQVSISVSGKGQWAVVQGGHTVLGPGGLHGFAVGGQVRVGSGPTADDVLARVSRGEYVVQAKAVGKYGTHMMDAINSMRFAQGGAVNGRYSDGATGLGKFEVRKYDATQLSLQRAVATVVQRALDQGFGAGNAITKYAEQYIGRVPYVWGGTTPAGWDCSGFSSWVYHHFGFPAPRTSQTQWQWVRRTPQPIAGGLAFFAGADGTVSSPGHVGIIVGPNKMVDAYGTGFGTRYNSIYGSSGAVSGFGVPPGRMSSRRMGGLITEPVMGIGLRTGRGWSLGEAGVERVTPGTGRAGPSAEDWLQRIARLMEDAPYVTGRALGDVLNGLAASSARSSYYATS